jgi:hypothetical protein
MKKRATIAVAAFLAVFGTIFGIAASLGPSTSAQSGAATAVVAACDTDGVTVSYTTSYDATDGRYEISSVTVSGISNSCDTKTLSLNLTNTAGTTSYGSASGAIADDAGATSQTFAVTNGASAESTEKVHIFIA